MIKAFFAVILLFFFMPVDHFSAQASPGGIKIYSGYLHQYIVKSKPSFWHSLFGLKPHKQEEVLQDRQCSIEFKSPVPFSYQSAAVIPQELPYFIRFKNDSFGKFVIKIYTNDDQEYSVDPDAEGKQVGINDEHHIFDSYLIYLILGTGIDHLEIVSPSGKEDQDRYVLDKLEIHDNP